MILEGDVFELHLMRSCLCVSKRHWGPRNEACYDGVGRRRPTWTKSRLNFKKVDWDAGVGVSDGKPLHLYTIRSIHLHKLTVAAARESDRIGVTQRPSRDRPSNDALTLPLPSSTRHVTPPTHTYRIRSRSLFRPKHLARAPSSPPSSRTRSLLRSHSCPHFLVGCSRTPTRLIGMLELGRWSVRQEACALTQDGDYSAHF
ncbi:hypothetical protein F5148DRAFT_1256623 [Russula earlei]|uniref:Uncharacterized protein n=1 Tax=Russula earlei TaxID=71964 RepID=A0ACC0TU38_9AGAM|nr:hypothetical protein F5148DRAFT_1256623 [Russula earlei]